MPTPDPSPAELLELLKYLTPEERAELDSLLTDGMPIWMPQVGPQLAALESLADIVFYGGSAGGGKTDLLLGAALTQHEHSIIFRREAVQLVGLEERMTKILGTRKGYNGQTGVWRLPESRVLELGSVKEPDDWMKYQGRPHDAKPFDEICHFLELQFRTLIGWMRTDNPKVRQRVICAGNPPTSAEGEWVIRFFAPWLDPLHPNPATLALSAGANPTYIAQQMGHKNAKMLFTVYAKRIYGADRGREKAKIEAILEQKEQTRQKLP